MSFLPPVVLEIRAQAAQFFAETAKVAEATKAMANSSAAAATGMADKVSASAAGMGTKVAASTESMSAKTSASTEAMARRIIAEAEQMGKGTTAATEAMVRNVVTSFETMAAKTTTTMEKQAQATTATMEASAAKIAAAEEALAAKVVAAMKEIEAAQAKAAASSTRTATETSASGLKMQESFIKTAAVAASSMGSVSAAVAGAALTQGQAAAKAEASIMGAANGITKIAAVSGLVIAAIGLDMAAHFQKSTTLLVTAGGEAKSSLEMVRSGILSIAKDTGTSTDQLADGMYVLEKAGYRGSAGLAALRASAEGAKAENVDLATMTDGVTTTLLDYGYKMGTAKEATESSVKVTNMMVAASGAAKTTMQDFTASLAAVVPIASSAHISFQEVAGSIATMTQHGQTAQQSSQNLANLVQALIRPNNQASASMQQMGIDTVGLAQHLGDAGLSGTLKKVSDAVKAHMRPDGMVVMDTMKNSASATAALREEMAQMPPELAKLSQGLLDGTTNQKEYQKAAKDTGGSAGAVADQFLSLYKSSQGVNDSLKTGQPTVMTYQAAMTKLLGNVTAARAATMLLMNNSEDLNRSIQLVSDAADQGGNHIETWAETQAQLSTQLDMAKQRSEVLAISIGTKLIPVALGALRGFQDLFDGFEKGNPVLMGIAGVIGGAVTLSIANFTVKMIEAGIASISSMIGMGARAIAMGGEFVAGFMASEIAVGQFSSKAMLAGAAVKGGLLPALTGVMAIAAIVAGGIALIGANTHQNTPHIEDMAKAMEDLANKSGDVSKLRIDKAFSDFGDVMGHSISNVNGMDNAIANLTHRDFNQTINDWADNALQPLVAQFGIAKSEAGQLDDRFKMIGQSLGDMVKGGQADTAAKGFDKIAEGFIKQGKSAQDALDTMPEYKKQLEDMAMAQGQALSPTELLELAMGKLPKKMQDVAKAGATYTDSAGNVRQLNETVTKSLDDMGISIDGEITNLGKLYDAMIKTGLANLSARDAEFHFGDAVDKASKQAEDLAAKLEGNLSSALDGTGQDFNKTTEAGQTAESAFSAVTQAGLNTASIMSKDVTKSQEDVTKSLHGTYTAMITTAEKFGLGATEAENLTRKVLGIPDGVSIDSWMNDTAKKMADDTKNAVNNIPSTKNVTISITPVGEKRFIDAALGIPLPPASIAIKDPAGGFTGGSVSHIMGIPGKWDGGAISDIPGLSSGGMVPGTPPSNPRIDNILAMVNGKPLKVRSGEFINNEPSTKKNMPWLKAMNAGLDMNSLFHDNTPQLSYASSPSLRDRQAAESSRSVTNNDNSRITTNHVTINSTADARSLVGEFSRLTANMS